MIEIRKIEAHVGSFLENTPQNRQKIGKNCRYRAREPIFMTIQVIDRKLTTCRKTGESFRNVPPCRIVDIVFSAFQPLTLAINHYFYLHLVTIYGLQHHKVYQNSIRYLNS